MEDEYISLAEISRMTGLTRTTVYSYHSRGKLPPPDRRLGIGPLWLVSTIDKWADRTVRGYKRKAINGRGEDIG